MFFLTPHERRVILTFILLALLGMAVKYLNLYAKPALEVKAPLTLPAKINVNSANEAQLIRLPGIGPVAARRIISYRSDVLRFYSVDDLSKVKGLSAKGSAKLASYVKFED